MPRVFSGGSLTGWKTPNAEQCAKGGIVVLLIIMVRTCAEYFRLRHAYGLPAALFLFERYLLALVVLAIQCLGAVVLLFLKRYWASVLVSAITIVILLIYKVQVIGLVR
jgi:hypothetical protein